MTPQFVDRLAGLAGWRRATAAVALGGLAALALPPLGLFPLAVPAFAALALLVSGAASGGRAFGRGFWAGFWFGFGHFLLSVHWIVEPLLVDAARTAWMMPFALPGLAALLAVFPALACAIAASIAARTGAGPVVRVILLALAWTLLEWVRGWIFTGFPWNLIGYVWADAAPVMQSTALFGIYGLSFLTVLAAAMPAALAMPGGSRRALVAATLTASLVLPAALWTGGALRLANAAQPGTNLVANVQLRIVQANIAQRDKWRPELRVDHLQRYRALTGRPADVTPTHVIWPETAVPFLLDDDPRARQAVASALPSGAILLTGSVRRPPSGGLYNAALAIDALGTVRARYDKSHLVPFGEYVPLRGILPVERIVPGQGDYNAGPGLATMDVPGLPPVSPLICYEAIFPGAATEPEIRPGVLVNLTNDGWFGRLAGPQQHFAIARTRAIEEGLPMVRAAGTGISAVVDPYGRVLERLDIGVAGVIDTGLPVALAPTPYARWGNLTVLLLGGAFALGCVPSLTARRRPPKSA